MFQNIKYSETLPVSFILPTFNESKKMDKCLKSICEQDYPQDKLEIIVIDGGSSDDTIEIAKKYNCKILYNPKKRADPGISLGLKFSKFNINFIVNTDNELPRRDWIHLMVKPFKENNDVFGVFTKIIKNEHLNNISRYWVFLHDHHPLNWFILKNVVDPDKMQENYGLIKKTPYYTIYNFNSKEYPHLIFGQGFGVRKDCIKEETDFEHVNTIIKMISDGLNIAYVPQAGMYHYTLDGLKHFINKFHFRIIDRMRTNKYGYRSRLILFTRKRIIRQYLWIFYSIIPILPLLDGFKGWIKDRDIAYFYHPVACITFSFLIIISFIEYLYTYMISKLFTN